MKSALDELKNALKAGNIVSVTEEICMHVEKYDLEGLILPARCKPIYPFCATIISCAPRGYIEYHAADLMEWFQDLNWPGADIIADVLRSLPKRVLDDALEKARHRAELNNDEEWLWGLEQVFPRV